MFGIGLPEMGIILVLVLVVFGAGKLPGVMSQIGTGLRDFRDSIADTEDTVEKIVEEVKENVKI